MDPKNCGHWHHRQVVCVSNCSGDYLACDQPAHVEAVSAVNGIGLVKLTGRSTGHITLHATLSSRDVDCCES